MTKKCLVCSMNGNIQGYLERLIWGQTSNKMLAYKGTARVEGW